MRDPYLIFSARLATASPEHMQLYARLMSELESALVNVPVTQLKLPGVFVAEVSPPQSFAAWRLLSQICARDDAQLGDDLQWFVHLADRRGCELSTN